ncbi:MAG: FecR family protein [Treponema sp.]|nr:FecR family protein [Treponema sp.]
MKKAVITALAFLAACASYAFDATVVSTKGKAEIMKGGVWQPLTSGAVVSKGDVIQTGFKSEVILKIKNSTVTMDALCRLTVEQLSEKGNRDETRLFLDTGSLKSDVQKSENRRVGFTVRSPVATASVRGTNFSTEVKFGGTQVTTHERNVSVRKTDIPEAQIAEDEEDKSPDGALLTGESEGTVAEASHRGEVIVSQGQATEVSESDAGVSSTQSHAAQEATSTGGSTTTQATVETVVQAPASQSPAVETISGSSGPKTARVVISVTVPKGE